MSQHRDKTIFLFLLFRLDIFVDKLRPPKVVSSPQLSICCQCLEKKHRVVVVIVVVVVVNVVVGIIVVVVSNVAIVAVVVISVVVVIDM